jgi:hypothetical protein
LFAALVDWVEHGIALKTLVARNAEAEERLLCLYPKKVVLTADPQTTLRKTLYVDKREVRVAIKHWNHSYLDSLSTAVP